MSFKRLRTEATTDEARNRIVNEVVRCMIDIENRTEASHQRHDTQLHDIVQMRTEIGRLQAVVDSQSDMIVELKEKIDQIREWAKTLKNKPISS